MTAPWDPSTPGVLRLPSGRLVRGRGLRYPLPAGQRPTYGLYLLERPPAEQPWPQEWVRWRDFWLPADREATILTIRDVWQRLDTERVEVACKGGVGRTGTTLACLAILDGVPAGEAVAYVREHYSRRAAETPWQRRFVARLGSYSWS